MKEEDSAGAPRSALSNLLKGRHAWLFFAEAIIVLPLFYFYAPCLTGNASFYISDLTWYFQPFLTFMGESFRRGEVPLWNPWMYCGMPQIAVPSPGLFYPLNVFFYVMPFSAALSLFLIVHQLIAGIGAFLLVRALGWGGFASLVAALACAWCGYMFSMSSNFTLMATIAWLPLAIVCARRVRSEFNTRNMLAVVSTAAVVFMMIAAGRPEVSVPAAIVLAIFSVVDVVARYLDDRRLRAALTQIGWRAGAGAFGLLLSMPIILPALEWAKVSPRASGLDPKYVFMWSTNWYDWLCVVLPQPFGDLSELGSHFLRLAASRDAYIPYVPSAFVGPVILVMAIWGLADRTWKGRWLVLAVAVLAGVMALGKFTPLAPLVVGLSPALSSFRYPVKLLIIPVLCLILLAARGAYLAHHRWVPWRGFIVSLVVCAVAFVTGAVFVLCPALTEMAFANEYFSRRVIDLANLAEAQILLGYNLLVMSAVGAGICLVYFALLRRKLPRLAFCAVVIFAEALLLLYAPTHYSRRFTAGNFYNRPVPLADEVRKLADFKEGGRFTWRVQNLAYDPLENPPYFSVQQKLHFQESFYQYGRQLLITNTHLPFALPYSFGYEAAETGLYKEWWDRSLLRSCQNRQHDFTRKNDVRLANFCSYTSTRYVWAQAWLKWEPRKPFPLMDPALFHLVREDQNFNLRLYECLHVQPRTCFATKIAWQRTGEDVKEALIEAKDASNTFLETSAADVEAIGKCSLQDEPGDAATLIEQAAQRTAVRTVTGKPRLLVFNDHLYNGWTAKIDGQPAPIARANIFARAVVVPAGEHTVVFEYASASLRTALYLVAAAVLGMLALVATAFLRRR